MEMWKESELISALWNFLLDRRYASMNIMVLLVIYDVQFNYSLFKMLYSSLAS
jgi:hypothetical protein